MTETAANTARRYRTAELDLLGLLETVIARSPKLLKNGLPNLAFFRAANAALTQPDEEDKGVGFVQVEFWLHMARGLELVEDVEGCLEVSDEADEFFVLDMAERRERLRQTWLESRDINEFALCGELELPSLGKTRTVDVTSDIPSPDNLIHGRNLLLGVIAELQGEIALTPFLRKLEKQHPSLFINHDDDGSWRQVYYRGIREAGGREDIERDGNWVLVEGEVVRMICELILSPLGWIDYDPQSGNLTPTPDEIDDEPDYEIVVQPNFEVMALGDRPDTGTLFRLARFTTPASEARVRKYILERKPFADALGRGHSADELTDFLAGLSRSPIPQNVKFSLNDWAELSDRIKIWPDALFIEAEGVENLEKLLSGNLLETLKPSRLAEGHFACPAPPAATLREVVPARRGTLDYSRRLPPAITPTESTDLRAPREDQHLRARQLLALVSESRATDRYELSRELVAKSAEAIGAEELLRRLREGLTRPLSAPLALALRTWSGEFDRPYAGGAEILLAEDDEQAELIEELGEVKRWIDRKLAPGVYLLRNGGTEEVHKALDAMGIELRKEARGK